MKKKELKVRDAMWWWWWLHRDILVDEKKNKENDCIVIEMKNKRFKPSQKYYFVTNHLMRKKIVINMVWYIRIWRISSMKKKKYHMIDKTSNRKCQQPANMISIFVHACWSCLFEQNWFGWNHHARSHNFLISTFVYIRQTTIICCCIKETTN